MSYDGEEQQPKLVRDREGYHLIYPVCEIEGEKIIIGYDGENPIVGGKKMTEQEYVGFDITEKQQERLGIPDKKMPFFRSQLPSIPHLNNVFHSKKQKTKCEV